MSADGIPILEPKNLAKYLDARISEALAGKGLGDGVETAFRKLEDQEDKVALALRVWKNNGFAHQADAAKFKDTKQREEARLSYTDLVDAMSMPDASMLMPRVMSQIVKEAIEPNLVLTPLLRQLRFEAGTSISFPSVSAMTGALDMAEGDEYPELMGPRWAGTVTAKIGKCGCSVRITEEMLRFAQWDIMSMLIQGAGKALARHKEVKVANLILDNAVVSFDNDSPGGAPNGRTTGRDLNADFNNSLRLDDLFVTYSDMINDGFIPNTLIVNPAGWLIFARDPSMRAFNFGNSTPIMTTPSGSNPLHWTGGGMGSQSLQTPSTAAELRNSSTLFTPPPSLFPVPLRIVVSPFITYNAGTKKTDIIMADQSELGLLVTNEDVMTDQFDDAMRDIRRLKFRERYGLCVLNEGKAIRKLKSVSTNRGYDWEDTKLGWDAATQLLPSV